jgi:hypothetical protein
MCTQILKRTTSVKQKMHTNSYVEHIHNSGTTLWKLGKEGKEKRMIEHQ